MNDIKVVFIGHSGSGKTSSIVSVSNIMAVSTDVINTDINSTKKFTTVGLDYGEVTLPGHNNYKLRLYGTPGQDRFSFLWHIIEKGSSGLIILIDNTSHDPLADAREYLQRYKNKIQQGKISGLLGIIKTDIKSHPDTTCYQKLLGNMQINIPVMTVDARDGNSVLLMLKILSDYHSKLTTGI